MYRIMLKSKIHRAVTDAEARSLVPRVVVVDAGNRVAGTGTGTGSDPAAALPTLEHAVR